MPTCRKTHLQTDFIRPLPPLCVEETTFPQWVEGRWRRGMYLDSSGLALWSWLQIRFHLLRGWKAHPEPIQPLHLLTPTPPHPPTHSLTPARKPQCPWLWWSESPHEHMDCVMETSGLRLRGSHRFNGLSCNEASSCPGSKWWFRVGLCSIHTV